MTIECCSYAHGTPPGTGRDAIGRHRGELVLPCRGDEREGGQQLLASLLVDPFGGRTTPARKRSSAGPCRRTRCCCCIRRRRTSPSRGLCVRRISAVRLVTKALPEAAVFIRRKLGPEPSCLRAVKPVSEGPPPALAPAQQAIAWAHHLVFFFPLWLVGMPALLEGLLHAPRPVRQTLIGMVEDSDHARRGGTQCTGPGTNANLRRASRQLRNCVPIMGGLTILEFYCAGAAGPDHRHKKSPARDPVFHGISP